MNKLLAPGPLIKGHADLEGSDCFKCHDVGQGTPAAKCLDCHKAIKPFVDKGVGFHGLNKAKSCRECHRDHKGRDFDTIAVDQKTFDHGKLTGLILEGKHAELKCTECHNDKFGEKSPYKGKIRYFGKQASCVSCHKKDDVHQYTGKFQGKDCKTCHDVVSWKKNVKFDHETDARYKLEGAHFQLKCAQCHGTPKQRNIKYNFPQLAKAQCLTCHKDQHAGKFSAQFAGKCTTCHTQEKWKIEKFDHGLTKFQLRGKHAELKCIECHKQKSATLEVKHFDFKGLKQQCLSCHKDVHKFGNHKSKNFDNPNRCTTCHTETGWKPVEKFDHADHTRFKIDGEHEKLKCAQCHMPEKMNLKVGIYRWPALTSKTCENCHKSPHRQEFSAALLQKQCTECHQTSGWQDTKTGGIDHSKTRFPLTNAHTKIRCIECHGQRPKQVFKFASQALKFCIDCHKNIHINQFSKKLPTNDCTACHTTVNFKERLEFDHNKRTRFLLDAPHSKLKCAECHKAMTPIALGKPNFSSKLFPQGAMFTPSQYSLPHVKQDDCLSCHVDHHQSQLGSQCLNCHVRETWKKQNFNHNTQSKFELKGKHQQVKCGECHKPIPNAFVTEKSVKVPVIHFKPKSMQCKDCHKDQHRGAFGQSCQECHSEKGWKITNDFHKNFTLTGVHYTLECAECHKDGRKLAGLSQECISCHAKDDVHNGTLTQCQQCHRQQFWEVSSFRHSLTQFPLRGVHRTIACMDCHRSGTYKGLSAQCSSCHLQDAINATALSHSPIANYMQCSQCHKNNFSFR